MLELLELFSSEFVFSDETEDSLGFKFSQGSSSLVIGVKFADTDFSGSIEDCSLVFFSQSFNEVLFHFAVTKLQTEINVEGSQEDFFLEVVLIVEFLSFFSIVELDFNESVLWVEWKRFYVWIDLLVVEEQINHLMLQGLLHVLNDDFFAGFDFLFESELLRLFHHFGFLLKFNY